MYDWKSVWLVLLALLIGGAAAASLSYWAVEKYIASTHEGDPLQKAGGTPTIAISLTR